MEDLIAFKTFDSFEKANQAERLERWRMTPEERMVILEQLRSGQYPDGKTAPRMERILRTFESSEESLTHDLGSVEVEQRLSDDETLAPLPSIINHKS